MTYIWILLKSQQVSEHCLKVGEERLIRAPRVRWAPHGFEKHSIVLALNTNTVSSYPQESAIIILLQAD